MEVADLTGPMPGSPPQAPSGPLLEAHELYRFYHTGEDEIFALRGVSVAVRSGEIVAVVGPSGSGKSTLLACLAGLDEPDGGHVMIAGRRITRRDEATRARLRARWIGMLLQSGNLLEHLTVAQNVAAAQALARSWTDRSQTDTAVHRDARALLDEVGLAGRACARPSTLSGGEAARAALAVAMANDPPVLLADEPTGEIDRRNEGRVLELLRARADRGKAVLVVTHSEFIASAADRVLRMADGRATDE